MSSWGLNLGGFLSGFQQQQQQQASASEDGSSGVPLYSEQSLQRLKAMLARNAIADLEVVRQAVAARRFQEPFAALPSQRLFAMPHFALFRPLFHEFLQLRLTLRQFEAQQRTVGREMGAAERAKRRREAKLLRLMTGKRRHKLKGARGGRGRGRRSAAGRSSGGEGASPSSAAGQGSLTPTSPTTTASPSTSAQAGQAPQTSATPTSMSQKKKKKAPVPLMSEAQLSKLETDFAVRINGLTAKLNAIPARPPVRVVPSFGGGGRQLPADTLQLFGSEQPLSEPLVKFRAWLLKEVGHLGQKVGRIVAEGRKRRAEREQQQQQQTGSASLSATPETPGSSGGPGGSAIGSTSTATSSR